ncbi:hypothetical protein LNP74_29905 [Klebsiella pneumoniae subsp. pneumoniae]|nr:hypothetical protein [Klebsiella pneumoniae subsp. pneumoniae]
MRDRARLSASIFPAPTIGVRAYQAASRAGKISPMTEVKVLTKERCMARGRKISSLGDAVLYGLLRVSNISTVYVQSVPITT